MSEQINPSEMTQEQLVQLGEHLLNINKNQHAQGSWERHAYDGALGLLGEFPHQPWYKRLYSRIRKRRAEKAMKESDQ